VSEGAGMKTPAFPTYACNGGAEKETGATKTAPASTPRRAEKRPYRAFRRDVSEGAGMKTPAFPTYACWLGT